VTVDCAHTVAEKQTAATGALMCPLCLSAQLADARYVSRLYAARLATARHLAAGKPGRFAKEVVAICDGVSPP
jgi:hypothetical protein